MVPTLSYRPGTGGARVDLDRLVASRMLVQANSGGGKSRALRQLLEETHGRVQHLVLDPEGEFSTLREKFDYVLLGKEGDLPATPKTAKLLCRRLVEFETSAVIDLYDLNLHERREFVKLFLLELMALPRALWHPVLVVIDEAHVFAPQAGESQALDAVISLCTQGRKRGFCAVLATQRISKLHKDAAAELLNKLIGRTGLDVDVKRAGDELGLNTERRRELMRLAPGEFFVYGPAIANEIQLVSTGAVTTSHPEAGKLGTTPPPPSSKVKALLAAQLADLPKEAEEEARTIVDLQRQLRDATARAKRAEKQGGERVVEKMVVDEKAVARAVAAATRPLQERHAGTVKEFRRLIRTFTKFADESVASAEEMRTALARAEAQALAEESGQPVVANVPVAPSRIPQTRPASLPRATTTTSSLPKGEQLILTAIAQYPDGAERDQLSILTGYKRSTRDSYIQRLGEKGFVDVAGANIVATEAGVDALGSNFTPLPTGTELQEYWLDRLPEGEGKILAVLLEEYPQAIARETLSDRTEYKRSTRDSYIQRLGSRRLVETSGAGIRASAVLFD